MIVAYVSLLMSHLSYDGDIGCKREKQSIIVELEARKECMVRAVGDWPQKTASSLLADIMMVYKKIAPSL